MEVLKCEKKGAIALCQVPDYIVDALKLPNQAPRGSGESLQKCVAWRCRDTTPLLLAICGQSLASNGSVVDRRDLNLVFGHAEATPNT
ncbi:hypothetical protein TNCV_2687281 [Trichonephila clavipes]|nr:hypothetical protein TNCV_2687281 [Trichonephila clavipes]